MEHWRHPTTTSPACCDTMDCFKHQKLINFSSRRRARELDCFLVMYCVTRTTIELYPSSRAWSTRSTALWSSRFVTASLLTDVCKYACILHNGSILRRLSILSNPDRNGNSYSSTYNTVFSNQKAADIGVSGDYWKIFVAVQIQNNQGILSIDGCSCMGEGLRVRQWCHAIDSLMIVSHKSSVDY